MTSRAVKRGELFATFMFDGKDCADMGIYNVTSGSVYTVNIEPTYSDQTLEVPAYDGKYYYGTQITGQQFQFNCFCHDLLTTEYDRLRAWLHPRKIGRLILSDQPYKYYLCKVVSISNLSAFPLTTIQTPQHTLLGDYAQGDVVYTGNFSVTFETVGSAYGYGLAYYRDDLIYDAKTIYGIDYYYNSGLLYRDMTPRLAWTINANAQEQEIPIYNPGSAATAPIYTLTGTFGDHSYIQINNNTIGSSTVIDVSGLSGDIQMDMISQVLIANGREYYGRFKGSAMNVAPYRTILEIPETFVENIENTNLIEYDTFYIENNVVKFNSKVVNVDPNWVGYYFCCNYNGGSKIVSVDTELNQITLSSEVYTQDIPRGDGSTPSGIPYNYRPLASGETIPSNPQENDIYLTTEVVEDGRRIIHCWVYMKRTSPYDNEQYRWVETNYFSDDNDFRDIYGDYNPFYKVFGATILELDDITITTGNNINYKDGKGNITPGDSIGECILSAEMLPRYL